MVKAPECRPKKSENPTTSEAPPTAQASHPPPAEDRQEPEVIAEPQRPIHPNERIRNQPVWEEWVSIALPEPRAPRQNPREREAEHRANAEQAHRENNPVFEYMVNERARREEQLTEENTILMDTVLMLQAMRSRTTIIENDARVPTAPIATDYFRQFAQRNMQRRNEVHDELEFLGIVD
ncbi:hypothetical protein L3Y34_005394 [Caenorhabditis briggsae]|uniref:Uncharacterized protein n=1 Tax=Caenorhabditis briggsae TaxID=6238 RepID=A0AAE9AEJ2_CAEBR|nr:hypothetical protein L3Y34_005394 [Caenorhabditis briggsae]